MSDEEYEPLEHVANILEKVAADYRALRAENAKLLNLYDGGVAHWRDVLDKMEAENLRLREALKPLSKMADNHPDRKDDYHLYVRLLVGDLRAARAAMGERDD